MNGSASIAGGAYRDIILGIKYTNISGRLVARGSDVTAIIAVSGSAREPDFAFSLEPDLPQDEVISRILFSKASGGLSAIQALQLAQVAAQFSGGGVTVDFDVTRNIRLKGEADANGGTAVGAGVEWEY